MEIRQLRYLVAIARNENFGRAARDLNVTQPALSRQILKLERELGTQLFIRHSSGASLTPEAAQLLPRVQNILKDIDDVAGAFRSSRAKSDVTMPIGLSPGTAELIVVPLSRKAAEVQPNVRLHFMPALLPTRHEMLMKGKILFALMNAPPAMPGLTIKPLLREQLCLICRPVDPFASRSMITLRELSEISLVLGGLPESGVRGILDVAMRRAGLPLNVVAEVSTAGASKPLVLAGVGPTVHVAAMARAELNRGELVTVPIEGLYSSRVIAHANNLEMTPPVTEMMGLVRDCVQDMVQRKEWLGGELVDA